MTDAQVDFHGCKISHTDAEEIRYALEAAGYDVGDGGTLRVLNACCITAEAEKKARKHVRRMLADGAERVIITGCGATLAPDTFAGLDAQRVVALPGPASAAAARIVAEADALSELGCRDDSHGPSTTRTRAFVKVQDGCDFPCSYCIVPTVRGGSRSRPLQQILDDVAARIARGQREIVLTGINIGTYRDQESRLGLPGLARAVAQVTGVARVRISSIEINHVTPRLLETIADTPRLCPHLHIPLQSGDDGVLAAMRRNYDSARFRRSIERARVIIPDLNLTTDVIVGFPGEDDAAFSNTRAVCDEVGFTKVHTFPFSARPGTDAADYSDQVTRQVKQERGTVLRADAHDRARRRWEQLVGVIDDVICERRTAGPARGYLRDYTPVARVDGAAQPGVHAPVRVIGTAEDGVVVTPVGVG